VTRPTGGSRPTAPPLASAHDLLAGHRWEEAYDLLAVGPGSTDPAWLEALATAAWWVGRLDECIAARERAYARYEEDGARRDAGRCAAWLFEHYCFRAQPVIGGAWLRRAARALEDDGDSVERGQLAIRQAQLAHGGGDLTQAAVHARDAIELGRRLRAPDVEALGLEAIGRILIDSGQPADGLAHLDEAMLFALEGRLDAYTTGRVFCSLVSACDELGDLHRAAQWTDAVSTWSAEHPVSLFPGLCRVHRAGLLQWRGDWVTAEAEARRASAELETINLPNAGAGFVVAGEIRGRLGDHDGAEEAFRRAEELNGQVWAGLALLRLAQGRVQAAAAITRRALDETAAPLARGRLLPVHVQVMVAAGDAVEAAAAADELDSLAATFAGPVLQAAAATSRGRVQLATGDHDGACATLHDAITRWSALEVPYEVAVARSLLGVACRATGDEDGADAAFASAEAIFDRLGATIDAEATRSLRGATKLPCGLSAREGEVLRLVASGRTNRQMAAELHLSEKTVARHVSNIFTKIGVRSRAAATAWAFEQRIVKA
jgi:DNA-binding CsgD family transcriptional regulator